MKLFILRIMNYIFDLLFSLNNSTLFQEHEIELCKFPKKKEIIYKLIMKLIDLLDLKSTSEIDELELNISKLNNLHILTPLTEDPLEWVYMSDNSLLSRRAYDVWKIDGKYYSTNINFLDSTSLEEIDGANEIMMVIEKSGKTLRICNSLIPIKNINDFNPWDCVDILGQVVEVDDKKYFIKECNVLLETTKWPADKKDLKVKILEKINSK